MSFANLSALLSVLTALSGSKTGNSKLDNLLTKQDNNFHAIRVCLKRVLKETNAYLEGLYTEELGQRAFGKLSLTDLAKVKATKPQKPDIHNEDQSSIDFAKELKEVEVKERVYVNDLIGALAKRNNELFSAVVEDVLEITVPDHERQEVDDLIKDITVSHDATFDALVKVNKRLHYIKAKHEPTSE